MSKSYVIACANVLCAYDFKSEDGKQHKGVSCYALVQVLYDGVCRKIKLCKMEENSVQSGDSFTTLYFDEFGRIVGGRN